MDACPKQIVGFGNWSVFPIIVFPVVFGLKMIGQINGLAELEARTVSGLNLICAGNNTLLCWRL